MVCAAATGTVWPRRTGRVDEMDALRAALLGFGYPVSIVVIVRWMPVVRERRIRWFAFHHAAVIAIIVGWAIAGDGGAVVVNSTWLVFSTLWYTIGRPGRDAGPEAG